MTCTVEQAHTIIDCVAEGRSVRSVCKEYNYSRWSFYALLDKDGVLANRLLQACAIRDEGTEEEIIEIADGDEEVAKVRNRLDARYKVLAARRPQRWGQKLDLSIGIKPDARAAEQRADQRVMRLSSDLERERIGQLIDVTPTLVLKLADKQSAGAIDNGPDDVEPDIFAAS